MVVFHGPRCLARYQAEGQLIEAEAGGRKDLSPRSRPRSIVTPRAIARETFSAHG